MSLKHGLLGLLNYGSMTGYDLNKAFKDSLAFFWQAQASQIYRELDAMEKSGWLSSEKIIQDDKPNKRLYSITKAGKSEFVRWLSSPEADIEGAMRIKSAFLMRVFFAGEIDSKKSLEMLHLFQKKCLKCYRSLSSVPDAINEYSIKIKNDEKKTKYWKISALFGEIFYRAELEWAKKAIAILEGKK